MSAVLKVFIGLIVFVCLMQFIEMAPQQEQKEDNTATKVINDLSEQIKNAFSDDNLKKLVDTASSAFSEGAKAFESQMKEWKEKLEHANEKKE